MSELPEMTEIPETEPGGGLRWFGIVLLIAQLGLLALGIVALWQIGGGWWLGALAGGIFTLIFLVVWILFLAPGSRQRLGYRERLLINLLVGPAVVVMGGLTSLWLPALVALSVTILCDALDERRR